MTQSGARSEADHDDPTAPATNPAAAHAAGLVIGHLFAHGEAGRTELATASGLGRSAASALLHRMLERGVLVEDDAAERARGGRLSLAVADRLLLTAGIVGDDAVATLTELDGTEVARYEEPALVEDDERPGPAAALDALAQVVERTIAQAARDERGIATLAVAIQGAVAGSPELAVLDDALGLEPIDVVSALRARSARLADIEPELAAPPTLISTPTADAVAEAARRSAAVLLHLTGDTQVAAGIAIGGMAYRGAHGLAGTFGHLPVVPDGVRCACGQRGCLTTVASPGPILERAELREFEVQYGRRAALEELATRIAAAEDRARWAWLDAALWIGRALQVVVPTIDPDVVSVGGWWAPLAGDIEAAFRDNRPALGGGALDAVPRIVPAATAGFAAATAQARERLRASLVAAAA
ncbi:ROK family protein [Agromyces aurantiacus]|uniref:ROK family protein n=1 Tax=Agromyces aurantiacus TaxID=165814 RepID=A0ABV9R4Q9_9MICO|nr:ROK family protein [Agromyces aurantiacus]MBM7503124.1 putative NBD/HSP70 family sugar kinase [Agromyces aurantiacus]